MQADPVQLAWGPDNWEAWDPWTIASLLDGVQARWYVAGGWALDLFHGRQTRPHEDLEIGVPLWEFDPVRDRLSAYDFYVAGREGFWPVEAAGPAYFEYQQTMVRDPATESWRLDVLRCPDDGVNWICALDRTIHRPHLEAITHTPDGIPYLRPELVLLFKALQTRPKDQLDFDSTAPHLTPESRAWLATTLIRASGPDHPWLERLSL